MEKCYSTNNEDFNYTELEDAIRDAFDNPEIVVGSEVSIFEGDAIKWKAGELTGFTLDSIVSTACDEGGEYADGYLEDVTKEQEADLDKRIAETVNKWADDYGLQPNFYRVTNVAEIRVKMISEDGSFEILGPPADIL